VSDSRITELLADPNASLDDIAEELVAAANAAGGPDNITALILQIDAS
jgi:serine/threonine protein phosphatase PrpC